MGEKLRELYLYAARITKDEIKQFLDQLTKRRYPALRLFDFSYFISALPSPLIIKKSDNTIRYYIKEKAVDMAPLFFPFKIGYEAVLEENRKQDFNFPKIYFFNSENHINLMIKEKITTINFNVVKIIGRYFGYARGYDKNNLPFFCFTLNPLAFLEINPEKHPSIYLEILEPTIKNIATKSEYPIFSENEITFGIDNFDPFQNTLLIGEPNSGKTKTLLMLVRALEKRYGGMIRIIIIDASGDLAKELKEAKLIDYKDNFAEIINDSGSRATPSTIKAMTNLITNAIDKNNKQIERVVFYSIYLLSSIGSLSLENFGKMITDPAARMKFIAKSKAEEAKKFFRTEYPGIYEKNFDEVVVPIKNFISEWNLCTEKKPKKIDSLEELMEKNPTVVVNLDKNFFEQGMANFIYSSIIEQVYLLAVSRKLKRPTILIMDNAAKIKTNRLKDIISETPGANLSAYVVLNHLSQLDKEDANAIIENVKNIFCYKVSAQDAAIIAPMLNVVLDDYFKKNKSNAEIEEIKKNIITKLTHEECVIRYFDGKKYPPALRLRMVDDNRWSETPRMEDSIRPLTAPKQIITQKIDGAELFSRFKL